MKRSVRLPFSFILGSVFDGYKTRITVKRLEEVGIHESPVKDEEWTKSLKGRFKDPGDQRLLF